MGSRKIYSGVGGPWSPLSNPPPPPPGGGSKGRLSIFHVFHAYSMTETLSQSVTVTVTASLQEGGPPLPSSLLMLACHLLLWSANCFSLKSIR